MAEAESADLDRAPADRVRDLLGNGYIDVKRARAIELAVPEVREELLGWLGEFARVQAWRDFESFAGLALHVCPEGLAEVLAPVVAAGTPGADLEDLVEILAEAGRSGGRADTVVPALSGLLELRVRQDGPYYGLCLKVVAALGAVGGPAAYEALRALAAGDCPEPVRWQAAAELRAHRGPHRGSGPDAAAAQPPGRAPRPARAPEPGRAPEPDPGAALPAS